MSWGCGWKGGAGDAPRSRSEGKVIVKRVSFTRSYRQIRTKEGRSDRPSLARTVVNVSQTHLDASIAYLSGIGCVDNLLSVLDLPIQGLQDALQAKLANQD